MAEILKTRTAQWPLVAEFSFTVGDTLRGTAGAFGANGAVAYEIINLPAGAYVNAVDFITTTAFDSAGAVTASLGVTGALTKYANAADVKAVGKDSATIDGTNMVSDGKNVILTLTNTGASTAGAATVRLTFTIPGRANETYPL